MHRRFLRIACALSVMVVVAAACANGETSEEPTGAPPSSDTEEQSDGDRYELDVYEVGMFSDIGSESWWAYLEDADAWTEYVLRGTACQLYELSAPNFTVTPQLAAHDLPAPQPEGDGWFVEVTIHDGASWSDGEPITAHDVEFTWETVTSLPLGGQWLGFYQPAALEAGSTTSVVAVDEHTVRIEFASEPGLGNWPMALGLASIMPGHHWAPVVDAADEAADLLVVSGAGSPSCGPFVFAEREEGAFARVVANEHWPLGGTHYTHYGDGTVRMVNETLGLDGRFGQSTGQDVDVVVAEYVTGPHAGEVVYTLYGNAAVGVGALVEGEIDFLLTGPGLEAAAQDRIFDAADVEAVVNANYSLQFLGFNLEREPMSDLAFREAVATVIDREHITDTVMGGGAFPLYTRMPPGNTAWYDPEVGERLTARWADFDHQGARVQRATEILAAAGYTWEVEPVVDADRGEIVTRGAGIAGPDGQRIGRIELVHPTAGYDPLRNTAGLFIAQFIGDLGFDVAATPVEFGQLVSMVIDPDDLRYDMAVLGWGLGNPALPTYYDVFWRGGAPLNIVGYSNADFDDAVARFMAAKDLAEAHRILWDELEPLLDRDLPYVPLFDTPKVEGYRPGRVAYPYTEVLGGLSNVAGLRDVVTAAQ